jgi:hypothetical protein
VVHPVDLLDRAYGHKEAVAARPSGHRPRSRSNR